MSASIELRQHNSTLEIKILNGVDTTIGRDHTNAISIFDSNVSRFHGKISDENDKYYYTDFSLNGSLVNNNKLQNKRVLLNHGDKIKISSYEIIYSTVPITDKVGSFDYSTKIEVLNTSHNKDKYSLVAIKSGKSIRIKSKHFTIGSDPSNHLVIQGLDMAEHELSIGSFKNGMYVESNTARVFVNNRNLSKAVKIVLDDGALIKFGKHQYKFYAKHKQNNKYGIITCSPVMKDLIYQAEKVAQTDIPVLILGETGTGKELFSKVIHENSNRANKPFVAVNCGAITKSLADTTLFGHKRGAFTDAKTEHVGYFKEVDGGTIFLDEIGELDPELQIKLLRAIEYQTIRPRGANKDEKIDVRIIAATNKMLQTQQVRADVGFRDDLYHRLSVFSLVIPPLSERRCDIIPLMEYFMEKTMIAFKLVERKDYSHKALEYAQKHDWPGNVRELKNVCTQSILLSAHKTIELSLDYKKIDRAYNPSKYVIDKIKELPSELVFLLKMKEV